MTYRCPLNYITFLFYVVEIEVLFKWLQLKKHLPVCGELDLIRIPTKMASNTMRVLRLRPKRKRNSEPLPLTIKKGDLFRV